MLYHSIVAVHGLNGHRESTFTAANGICWLSSLLPAQASNIRVLSYGYDARTHSSSLLTQEHLHDHAEQLIEELRRERTITKVNIHMEVKSIRPGHQDRLWGIQVPGHRDSFCGTPVALREGGDPGI